MSPARAKYRRLHSDSGLQEEARPQLEAGEVRERSLQSVLSLAQQELELEESEHQVQCLCRTVNNTSQSFTVPGEGQHLGLLLVGSACLLSL